jgi:hypothetical protein
MVTPSSGVDSVAQARRWPARSVLKDEQHPIENSVCAAIWPIRSLISREDWFEELHFWTEGFEASLSQRARIQSFALERAFQILDGRDSGQIAVTLSFGTVERNLDHLAGVLESHAGNAHRLVVILRGSFDRLRSRYRLRGFVEYLHMLHISAGYLLPNPRVSRELKGLGLLQPDFAKVPAPALARLELWQDLALEARVAGGPFDRLIVTGLDTQEQVSLAKQVGIPFGQGRAIAPAYAPPLHEVAEAAPAPPPVQPASEQEAIDGDATQERSGPPTGLQLDLVGLWNPTNPLVAGGASHDEE